MRVESKRCPHCGTQALAREVADDERCACGSRICLLSSAHVCITTNRPRTGTFRLSEYEAKDQQAPRLNRMVAAAGIRKG